MKIFREKNKSLLFLVPLVLSFFILFFRLSTKAFIDYDEAAFSEVVRETLKAHQLLSFRFINAPWFHKPPLYFWLAMVAVKFFPSVEFAMRSVSALFGVALVMLVYALAKLETENEYVALASSLIFLSIGSFVDLARQVKTDIPVIFCIFFSYYAYLKAVSHTSIQKKWKWFLLFGLAIAAGVLFKSVIGFLVLPLIVIRGFYSKNWSWLKEKFFWSGLLFAGIIIAPWHIYETLLYGNMFWNNYLFGQVVQRLTSNLFNTHLTFIQLIGLFILNTFPWIIVFILSLFFLRKILNNTEQVIKGTAIRISLLTSCTYIIFIFFIFSLSRTRVDYYLAPSYPFLAIFISYAGYVWWQNIIDKSVKTQKYYISSASILLFISAISMIAVGYDLLPQLSYEQHIAEDEKKIGLMLRTIPQNQTVYFNSQDYWETVRFYSGGKILEHYQPGREPQRSLIVVLTADLNKNHDATFDTHIVLYKGEFVSLIQK